MHKCLYKKLLHGKKKLKREWTKAVEMHLFAFGMKDVHKNLICIQRSKRPWSLNMPLICALQGRNFPCRETPNP
jgi:hypothetical protein